MNKQEVENAITGFEGLKPILQAMLRKTNYEGLGEKDSKEIGEHFDIAIQCMKRQLNDSWIPVSERLPKDFERALTCDEYGNIHIMMQCGAFPFGISPNHERYYMPVAWKKLPQPYQDDTNVKTSE